MICRRWLPGCRPSASRNAAGGSRAIPEACDAYIAKHIIHDWSDEHCRKILRLMRQHLPATGRVLICDMVMPEDSTPSRQGARHRDAGDGAGGQGKNGWRVSCSVYERRFAALPHRRDGPADMRCRRGAGLSHNWQNHPALLQFGRKGRVGFGLPATSQLERAGLHTVSDETRTTLNPTIYPPF